MLMIAGVVWSANKFLPFQICPTCAGVAGTWLWILGGVFAGTLNFDSWKLIVAIMMGGSVVGATYQGEYYRIRGSTLAWKMIMVPVGFIWVYSVVTAQFVVAAIAIVTLAAASIWFLLPRKQKSSAATRLLEEKMKSCC